MMLYESRKTCAGKQYKAMTLSQVQMTSSTSISGPRDNYPSQDRVVGASWDKLTERDIHESCGDVTKLQMPKKVAVLGEATSPIMYERAVSVSKYAILSSLSLG